MNLVESVLVFAGCVAGSAVLTWAVLRWLRAHGVMDHPNHRSSHRVATPRGGGAGPVLVVLGTMAWMAVAHGQLQFPLVAATAWVGAVSLLDDLSDVRWWVRLATQAGAVALVLATQAPYVPVFLDLDLALLDAVLVGICWLWFINLYNFMDGIDGLAASEAIAISAGALAVLLAMGWAGHAIALPLAIAGAGVGFLVWNWSPARVFMGDVGSVTLGFILGYLLVMLAGRGATAAAFILPGYFLVDATWTLLRRLVRRERVWRAHREHAYQKAVQAGWSHGRTVLAITAGNLLLVLLALWSLERPVAALLAAVLVAAGLRAYLATRGSEPAS